MIVVTLSFTVYQYFPLRLNAITHTDIIIIIANISSMSECGGRIPKKLSTEVFSGHLGLKPYTDFRLNQCRCHLTDTWFLI